MSKFFLSMGWVTVLLVAKHDLVSAGIVVYEFGGVVTSTQAPDWLGISAGSTFSGHLAVNKVGTSNEDTATYEAVSSINLAFQGGLAFQRDVGSITLSNDVEHSVDEFFFGYEDQISVFSGYNLIASNTPGISSTSFELFLGQFDDGFSLPSLLNNANLEGLDIDWQKVETAQIFLRVEDSSGTGYWSNLSVTSFSAVPEPNSLLLVLGGMALVGLKGRRNRRGA